MFQTKKQLDRGSVFSGLGLLGYLLCLQFALPTVVTYAVLIASAGIALWTEVSILCYPKEQKDQDINYNNLWGQSAMTLLLVGSLVMSVYRALGL